MMFQYHFDLFSLPNEKISEQMCSLTFQFKRFDIQTLFAKKPNTQHF